MTFEQLILTRKKINKTLNILDWFDTYTKEDNIKKAINISLLRLAIFLYFLTLFFVFHFIYRLLKKLFLINKYNKNIKLFTKTNGYDQNYWKQKVDEQIELKHQQFLKENKYKMSKLNKDEDDDF